MRPVRLPVASGMVTVETALVLPSVLILATGCAWGVEAAWAQLQCSTAAAAGASAAGAGASPATVQTVATEDAPVGAVVSVWRTGAMLTVSVRFAARPLAGILSAIPAVTVSASDTAYRARR